MEIILAVVVGVLYGCGVYLVLRRSVMKLILGIALLAQAANLLMFTAAGLTVGMPPFIMPGEEALAEGSADALPQALILTAIVIGFGVLAFKIVMIQQAYRAVGTDDLDKMKGTDS